MKIYLDADPRDPRNRPALAERPEIGADALATDLRLRDESDAARMRPAEDATQIDTTDLDVEDVVAQIEELSPEHASPRKELAETARDRLLLGRVRQFELSVDELGRRLFSRVVLVREREPFTVRFAALIVVLSRCPPTPEPIEETHSPTHDCIDAAHGLH